MLVCVHNACVCVQACMGMCMHLCVYVCVCVYVSTRAGRFCNFSARYIV